MTTTTKRCNRCLRTRPLTEFWRDRTAPDGVRTICSACATKARGTGTHHTELDPIAVDRAVNGELPATMTIAERREAVRILTERGIGHRTIATHLRITPRTVIRARRHLRLVPPNCPWCTTESCPYHTDRRVAA